MAVIHTNRMHTTMPRGGIGNWISRVRALIIERRDRRAFRRATAALSPDQLRDIGLTPADVDAVGTLDMSSTARETLARLSRAQAANW